MARSIKKGPYIDKNLFKKIGEMNSTGEKKMIKTYSRSSTIIPDMVGFTVISWENSLRRVCSEGTPVPTKKRGKNNG